MKKTLKNRSGFLHDKSSTENIKNFYMNKKGQVTIFVIVALIIIGVILFFTMIFTLFNAIRLAMRTNRAHP